MALKWNHKSSLGRARLLIRAEKYLDGGVASVIATIRVQTADGLWKRSRILPLGRETETLMYIPPGDYSISAVLPSGERIGCDGTVARGEKDEAKLRGRASRHEWLSWASYAMDTSYLQPQSSIYSPQSAAESKAHPDRRRRSLREVYFGRDSLRFWAPVPDSFPPWQRANLATTEYWDDYSFVAKMRQRNAEPSVVLAEVRVSLLESVFCWIPIDWRMANNQTEESILVIDLTPESSIESATKPMLRARATVKDDRLSLLTGYQRRGEVEALTNVSRKMATKAESLLEDKIKNPLLATAAALALLNTRQLKRLHDWTFNLAEWFPWLPDGAIIRAWQLLYRKRKRTPPRPPTTVERDEPLAWLLAAARRGLPVYAESLRLLVQGLRAFPTSSKDPSPIELETKTALHFYEQLLWGAQTRQGFTSVRGRAKMPPVYPH